MQSLLIGSFLVSIMHSIFPGHWLPVVMLGNLENWKQKKVLMYTATLATTHVFSTLLIGFLIYYLGANLLHDNLHDMHYFVGGTFLALGVYFIFKPHNHQHHTSNGKKGMFGYLLLTMLFSPCIEILPFFLGATTQGVNALVGVTLVYVVVSVLGIVLMAYVGLKTLQKTNLKLIHKWEGYFLAVIFIGVGLLTLMQD